MNPHACAARSGAPPTETAGRRLLIHQQKTPEQHMVFLLIACSAIATCTAGAFQ